MPSSFCNFTVQLNNGWRWTLDIKPLCVDLLMDSQSDSLPGNLNNEGSLDQSFGSDLWLYIRLMAMLELWLDFGQILTLINHMSKRAWYYDWYIKGVVSLPENKWGIENSNKCLLTFFNIWEFAILFTCVTISLTFILPAESHESKRLILFG